MDAGELGFQAERLPVGLNSPPALAAAFSPACWSITGRGNFRVMESEIPAFTDHSVLHPATPGHLGRPLS